MAAASSSNPPDFRNLVSKSESVWSEHSSSSSACSEKADNWSLEEQWRTHKGSQEDYPEMLGCVIKNPSLRGKKFVSFCPPDVSPDTRIVAVCGVSAREGKDSPVLDGWMLSDMFAFMQLFDGETKNQTWMLSADCTPVKLMEKYAAKFPPGYLHGDPNRVRKVVLDPGMITSGALPVVTPVAEQDMHDEFLETVKSECDAARKSGQPVLLIVLGHGDYDSYGITLGISKQNLENVDTSLLLIDELHRAMGDGVSATLMTNSCYSGGWAIHQRYNLSAITAAGPKKQSISWGDSTSYGRSCGSVWLVDVAQVLGSLTSPLLAKDLDPQAMAKADQDRLFQTYVEFTRQIHLTLFTDCDKFAYEHSLRFSAQDDAWEMHWARRSGTPLVDFKARWDWLQDYHAPEGKKTTIERHPSSIAFDEPEEGTSSRNQGFQHQGKAGSWRKYGSGAAWLESMRSGRATSQTALKSDLAERAKKYLQSKPGKDNAGSNTSVHPLVKRCAANDVMTSEERALCWNYLEYRDKKMQNAERLLEYAGVPFPSRRGKPCLGKDFDADTFSAYAERANGRKWSDIEDMVWASGLLGRQLDWLQGPSWSKPELFIAASLFGVKGINPQRIHEKLAVMANVKKNIIDIATMRSLRSREVRGTARSYYDSFGVRIRSLSPFKGAPVACAGE